MADRETNKACSVHGNDTVQGKSRNGFTMRKNVRYRHISQHFIRPVNDFRRDFLNPYGNCHRDCLLEEIIADAKGSQ